MMQKAKHFDKIEYRSSFPAAHNLCLLLPNVDYTARITVYVLVQPSPSLHLVICLSVNQSPTTRAN